MLLSDISNLTPDSDISAATEIFRTQLQQSAYLNVWDRRRLSAVFQKMGRASSGQLNAMLAREVAFREGVPLVVSATVAPVGDQFTVSILLEALEPGSPNVRTRWSQSFPATGKDQLLDAIHEACVWLRRKVGEQQVDIAAHDRPPEDVTTTSWQALARYWEAEQFQAARQSDKAIQMLKVAVTFDPHFALGYMRLGDILMATRQEDQGIHYWRQALAEAGRGHLTRHEELRVTGLYDADTWDWAGYEASFAQMEKEFPYDWLASFYLGDAYRNRGRLPEAIQAFERAMVKTKDSIPLADNLGTVAMEINDAARLRRETERLRRLGHPEFADQIEGEAKFAAADFAGALDIFRRVEGAGNPESASRAAWFEAAALAETGSVPAAEDILKKGIAKDAERGLPDAEIEKRLAARVYGPAARRLHCGPRLDAIRFARGQVSLSSHVRRHSGRPPTRSRYCQGSAQACRAGRPGHRTGIPHARAHRRRNSFQHRPVPTRLCPSTAPMERPDKRGDSPLVPCQGARRRGPPR